MKVKIVVSAILLFIVALVITKINDIPKRELFNKTPPNLANSQPMATIAWIPFWNQTNALSSYEAHVNKFTYVSVFWYTLEADGKAGLYQQAVEDKTLIDFAHKHNNKVLAVVANMDDYNQGGQWDANRVENVIDSEIAREEHIADLMNLVEKNNFDGIEIDYEALYPYQRDNFSLFIQELADALHKKGKILGVTIQPVTLDSSSQDNNGSQAQDIKKLAEYADHLDFMTYLEHTLGDQAGPPGSLDWIKQVMSYAIDDLNVPRSKIILGIGLMGISWKQNNDGSYSGEKDYIPFQTTEEISKNDGIQPMWDTSSQSPYITYTDSFGTHVIWFENAQSFGERMQLAKQLGVGVGLWSIGGEDPKIWKNF